MYCHAFKLVLNFWNMEQVQGEEIKSGYTGKITKPSERFRSKQRREQHRLRVHTLDLKKIRAYAEVGCPRSEIASLLNVGESWLDEAIRKDSELEEAIILGTAEFKNALRTTQARLALSGHPGMLIWLGKQFLGQSDKQESKQETTVNVVLQNAMKELRELDADTLTQMKLLLEQKKTPPAIDGVSEVIES